MTREDAARKVRALRATAAEGSGAFPAERETAKRMADRLADEHGLDRPAPAPAPRRDYGGFGFSVNVQANQFYSEGATFHFDPTDELFQRTMREALRDYDSSSVAEAIEAKRKRFRDILNGNIQP